jgi:DNA-binding winged helix-turn-helix (wHTH) protein
LNRIVTRDATLQLEPKVMKVLLCMVDRPGEVVTKEELFRDVWQGTFVTEDVLTRAVGELRRAFQDDAARPRVIETIRKSGYRLIAPIVPELPQRADAGRAYHRRSHRLEQQPALHCRTDAGSASHDVARQ